MSTVVTVWRVEGTPLSRIEMASVLEADPRFAKVDAESWRWIGASPEAEQFINLDDAALWTDGSRRWLEADAIEVLQDIATRLDARVLDEDGEDIGARHEVAHTSADSPASGTARTLLSIGGSVLFVLALPVLAIVAILRLPWIVWKILRRR